MHCGSPRGLCMIHGIWQELQQNILVEIFYKTRLSRSNVYQWATMMTCLVSSQHISRHNTNTIYLWSIVCLLCIALLVVPQYNKATVVSDQKLGWLCWWLLDCFYCAGVHLEIIRNTAKKNGWILVIIIVSKLATAVTQGRSCSLQGTLRTVEDCWITSISLGLMLKSEGLQTWMDESWKVHLRFLSWFQSEKLQTELF